MDSLYVTQARRGCLRVPDLQHFQINSNPILLKAKERKIQLHMKLIIIFNMIMSSIAEFKMVHYIYFSGESDLSR